MEQENQKQQKKNLWFYPLGTVGRDMIYSLFTNFILLFILYTKQLTNAQLGAVTAIMIAARVFDAINDPIMGNIIERTRTKWGKFKPWLLVGILTTCIVVYLAFNTSLTGWSFIVFFGVIYFAYSITYTMHDISYWGMVAALSSDGNMRNTFTSRATLFAGVGGTLASMLVPIFTTGQYAIGGNAQYAYGKIALVICILTPLFMLFTLFGVRERRDDMKTAAPKVSFKKIIKTITKNDQLVWMILIFLLQQLGNNFVLAGVGSTYVYFTYGYEGGLYSLFSTIGVAATALLMLFYPMLSRKFKRKQLMTYMVIGALFGFALQLLSGIAFSGNMAGFWMLTIGYMLSNLGLYSMYLIMMISIINTVEYNEYKNGERDEAIITSMRPFLTKMASAIVVGLTYLTYMIFRVTEYTNQISELEQQANTGVITSEAKNAAVDEVLELATHGQSVGMLLFMVFLPMIFMLLAFFLYKKFYKLDEDEYDRICKEIEARK
ncbi:MAG: MFS transporter [Lachnospiraceae bacterium]|nr:MFS transporter [Lachnospiraceae bacterium]